MTDRLDSLLSVYLAGRATGGPSPEEVCRDCPDLLPELKRRIAGAEFADALLGASSTGDGTGPDTAEYPSGVPHQLGEYRVRGVLGRGGMGVVLLADDPTLARQVAVKMMRADRAVDPSARERFLREARAAAAVRHEHVVPIFHVGEQDGAPYLVMPLLEGETLADRLRRGPLPPGEVARIGAEVAAGLAAAHAVGVVHRDVKPSNLWLEGPDARARVFDFGLARSADGADPLTQAGAVVGTAAYMAPEQADGREVGARADLFALGATLYECATGVPPFRQPTLTATLRAVVDHHPPAPHEVNPAVPAALSELIVRLLAKRAEDRPASAAAVAAALAAGEVVPAEHRPASRALGWAAGLALLALAGVGIWLGTRAPAPQNEPTPPVAAANPDAKREVAPPAQEILPPVRITQFDVRPHRRAGGIYFDPLTLLGREGNPSAATDEAIDVNVALSRSMYCYLVVFRADGADQVLYPQDDTDVPPKTDRPVYPSKRRGTLYSLDDGPGQWAVALITSDDPLPSYREWRGKHPGGPWKANPVVPSAVMLDDGVFLETFAPKQTATRGPRGEKAVADRAPVVGLVDWLKAQTGSSAAALAFPVRPAK